ncbi:MAG: hypothetical protein QXZ59_04835 [Nitrososphaeria archaeon]
MFDEGFCSASGGWKPQMRMMYRIVKPLLEKGKIGINGGRMERNGVWRG